MNESYSKILHLPHHTSSRHKPMSIRDRAAQFAPFAALTGYEEAAGEMARRTDSKLEPDDQRQDYLDSSINRLIENGPGISITVTYFEPDRKKVGGKYISASGIFRRMDEYEHFLQFEDGRKILLCDIWDIQENTDDSSPQKSLH